MYSSTSQEEEERGILDRLGWLDPVFRETEWSRGNPPEPDYFRRVDGRMVGLEITTFHRLGEPLKKKESEEDLIVGLARESYKNTNKPPLTVRVYWNHGFEPKKKTRQPIARDLYGMVMENIPQLGERITIDACDVPAPSLPDGVDRVVIDRVLEYTIDMWNCPRAAFVPDISSSDIQTVITSKSKKYKGYSGVCSELWLLIVAEGLAPSSHGIPTEEMIAHKYISKFSRVIYASLMPPRIIRLATAN